jgi:hypothetical protein
MTVWSCWWFVLHTGAVHIDSRSKQVELWKDADPEIQPRVDAARRRLRTSRLRA